MRKPLLRLKRIQRPVTFLFGIVAIFFCAPLQVKTATLYGTFTNLNFESANLPTLADGAFGGAVSSADGLPGWSVFLEENEISWLYHDSLTLGFPMIQILGPGGSFQGDVVNDDYSLFLSAPPDATMAVSQEGQIPFEAKSVLINKSGVSLINGLQVSFDGEPVELFPYPRDGFTIFAGDISPFAGRTGELRFGVTYPRATIIDNIRFSTVAVPEPRSAVLFVVGGVVFLGVYRFGRGSRRILEWRRGWFEKRKLRINRDAKIRPNRPETGACVRDKCRNFAPEH